MPVRRQDATSDFRSSFPGRGGSSAPRADQVNYARSQGPSQFEALRSQISRADDEASGIGRERREREEPQEANYLDRIARGFGEFGEALSTGGGAFEDLNPVENPIGFVASLPLGTFGSIPTGVRDLYEMGSGRGVQGEDEDQVEMLTPSQQVGAGVNALINLGGPFLGGSGRMLKGTKHALQAGLGRLTGRAAESAARNAYTGLGGLAIDTIKDAAEEGGEEFVQSFADDLRNESFDDTSLGRAAEAAGWGALGGGIMSLGGTGLNTLATRISPNGASADGKSKIEPVQTTTKTTREMFGFGDENRDMLPDAVESATERLRERQKQPGSSSVLQINTVDDAGIDDAYLSDGSIRSMFYANDEGKSAKMVADWFGTDIATMDSILRQDDASASLQTLVDHRAGQGDPEVILGRNPDTDNGLYTARVRGVYHGDGIHMSRVAASYVSSDFDGDQTQMYLSNTGVRSKGYISDNLMSNAVSYTQTRRLKDGEKAAKPTEVAKGVKEISYQDRGKSNIAWNDVAFLPRSINKDAGYTRDYVRERFVETFRSVLGNDTGDAMARQYADAWVDSGIGGTEDATADFFNTMKNEVNEAVASGALRGTSARSGNEVISSLIPALAEGQEAATQRMIDNDLADVRKSMTELTELIEVRAAQMAKTPTGRGFSTQGDLGIARSFAEIITKINGVVAKWTDQKNSVMFRQHGEYMYKATSRMLRDLDQIYNDANTLAMNSGYGRSVFEALIEFSAKQMDAGVESVDSVSTTFNRMVSTNARIRFMAKNGGRVASSDAELTLLLNTFKEEWNKQQELYNKAVSEYETARAANAETDTGEESGTDTIPMPTKPKVEGEGTDADVVRAFREAFGDALLESYMKVPQYLEGYTLNEIAERVIATGDTVMNQYATLSPQERALVEGAVNDRFNRELGLATGLELTLTREIAPRLARLYQEYRDNGGLTTAQRLELEQLVTTIRRFIDPKVADAAGLTSADRFFESKWGQALATSGRVMDAFTSLVVSGKYDTVYRYLIAARGEQDAKRAATYLAWARHYMSQLENVSMLDDAILRDLYEVSESLDTLRESETFSRLYDAITTFDVSYEEMRAAWNTDLSSQYGNFLADVLKSSGGSYFSSEMSARNKSAAESLAQAIKYNETENLAQVDALFDAIEDQKMGNVAERIVTDMLADGVYDYEENVIGAAAYATTTIANSMKEKGLTPTAAQIMYMVNEYNLNGCLMSFADKVFGMSLGRMSMRDFRSNGALVARMLTDPSLKVYVYDERTSRYKPMTRAEIIKDVDKNANPNNMTLGLYRQIFTKYPSLVSLIADRKVTTRIDKNGSPSVTPASSTSARNAILGRVRTYQSTMRDSARYAAERRRRVAKAVMLNDADLIADVIQCLDTVSGNTSMSAMTKTTGAIFNRLVSAVEYEASHGQGKEMHDDLVKMRKSVLTSTSVGLKDMMEVADIYASMVGAVDSVKNDFKRKLSESHRKLTLLDAIATQIISDDSQRMAFLGAWEEDVDPNDYGVDLSEYTREVDTLMAIMFKGYDDWVTEEVSDIEGVEEAVAQSHEMIDRMSDEDVLGRIRDFDNESEADFSALASKERSRLKRSIDEDSVRNAMSKWASVNVGVGPAVMGDEASMIITLANFDEASKHQTSLDELVRKVALINQAEQFDTKDIDAEREKIEEIAGMLSSGDPKRRADGIKKANDYRRFWNNLVVKRFVDRLNRRKGTAINPNMDAAKSRWLTSVTRMIDDTRKEMKRLGMDTDLPRMADEQVPAFPVPNFADSTIEYMANVATVNSTRGPAALTVGLNGANLRAFAPLNTLRKDYRAPVAPREMTPQQMLSESRDDDYPLESRFIGAMVCEGQWSPNPGPNGWTWQMRPFTVDDYVTFVNNPDPDAKILIFDPDDSPNGVDMNCTNAMVNNQNDGDFLMTVAQIGKLLDGSQEGMALQLSKMDGTYSHIAERTTEREELLPQNNSVDATGVQQSDLRAHMKRGMVSYRRAYRKYLTEVFSSERASILGLGPVEAYNFAKMVTPYFEVDLSDGTTVIVDAFDVFSADPSAFDAAIAEATSGGATVVAYRPIAVSIREVTGKIAFEQANALAGGASLDSVIDGTANDAVSHWAGRYHDDLTVEEILSGVTPVGVATSTNLYGDDRPPALSRFLSLVYGDGYVSRPNTGPTDSKGAWSDKDHYRRALELYEGENTAPRFATTDGASAPGIIPPKPVKSFRSSTIENPALDRVARSFDDLRGTDPAANNADGSTAGIVFSDGDLVDAMAWSIEFRQPLYVPVEIATRTPMLSDGDLVTGIPVAIGKREFYLFSPYENKMTRTLLQNLSKSAVWDITPDDARIILSDRTAIPIGDSMFYLNGDTMSGVGLTETKTVTINPDRLFSSRGNRVELATIDDIKTLEELSRTDPAAAEAMMDLGGEYYDHWVENGPRVMQRIHEALSEMARENTAVLTRSGRNRVIAFVKTNTTDGVRFSPIILSSGATDEIANVGVERGTGGFRVTYDNISSLGRSTDENRAHKASIDGRSDKGIGVLVSADRMPQVAFLLTDSEGNRETVRVDGTMNYHTDYGRNAGRWLGIMEHNLMYMLHGRLGGGLLYEESNGTYGYRKYLTDHFSSLELVDLANGSVGIWQEIADGNRRLFDDDTPYHVRLNMVIRDVARQCIKNGIPCSYMFSAYSPETLIRNKPVLRGKMFNYSMALNGVDRGDLLLLFNAMNSKLCPSDMAEIDSSGHRVGKDGEPDTVFDEWGRIYVTLNDRSTGEPARNAEGKVIVYAAEVSVGPVDALMHSTDLDRNTGVASYSIQHSNRQGFDRPMTPGEIRASMTSSLLANGREDAMRQMEEGLKTEAPVTDYDLSKDDLGKYLEQQIERNRIPGRTYKEWNAMRKVIDAGETLQMTLPINLGGNEYLTVDPTKQRIDRDTRNAAEMRQVIDAYSKVNRALGASKDGSDLSWEMFLNLVKRDSGITYNDGEGRFEITVNQLTESADRIARSISDNGLVVSVDRQSVSYKDRFAVPLLSPDEQSYFWQFENVRTGNGGNFENWVDSMRRESRKAAQVVANIEVNSGRRVNRSRARRKQHALYEFIDWTHYVNGDDLPSGRIYGSEYTSDLVRNSNNFWSIVYGRQSDRRVAEVMIEADKEVAKKLEAYKKMRAAKYTVTTLDGSDRVVISVKSGDHEMIEGMLDYLTRASQLMGVLSPSVALSNYIDKGVHTSMTTVALKAGRALQIGPYATDIKLNHDAVTAFSTNELTRKVWNALREAAIDGDEAAFLSTVTDEASLDEWISKRKARGNRFTRATDFMFRAVNAGNAFTNLQIENFVQYFFMVEHEAGHDWWFETDETGERRVDQVLSSEDSFRFLIDVLTGKFSPSMQNAIIAQNFALQGDQAQRSLPSIFYQWLVRRYGSAAKFITSTTMSRFVQYRMNQAGRTLNHILPVSTLNYVFVNQVAKTGWGEANQVMDAQTFTNVKRAIMADAAHMAPTLLGLLLASIPSALTPPDDEDKWGDPTQWLIFGERIWPDWELQDCLGLALPLATFWKSCALGNTRFDLITNGVASACYGNPMTRLVDVIGLFGDPETSIIGSYEQDVETYADAPGGSPDFSTWIYGKFGPALISYAGQFVTPTFVREFFSDPWEHSYNRVYETDPAGRLTEEGTFGRTQRTDYLDAQIRKATRNNPIMGWLLNWTMPLTGATTGYMEGNMPYTQIPEEAQVEASAYYSINDENGDPLPYEVQEQRIAEVITVLMAWDDMEELYQSGFYLDYDTRDAVGDTIWDVCTSLTNQYYEMIENGELDYYYLGDGDFATGQARAQEITNAYYDELNFWKSLYYDKLQSEPLRRGMTMYRRYKTSYATDDNGDVYATGFRTSNGFLRSLLPVMTAPDSLHRTNETAGYEGDFQTVSAVTGLPVGSRALVPVETEGIDYVEFEDHAASGDGTGYSKRWNGDDATSGGDDDGFGGGRYGGRYPTYGYRRRGGGGGGGGGYSPNIYSRVPNLYAPSARTMYAERVYGPNYDYLRPNFETKGSREAYKRSDI